MYCTHERAHLGLDAAYCPDCQKTFDYGSTTYGQILKRGCGREPPEDTEFGVVDNSSMSRERNSEDFSTSTPEYLTLDEIRRDGGTQPRAAIDLKHVLLLEEQMEDWFELWPITVFYDGESYWLADGYHRWHAHRNQGREEIACIINHGSRRDAILFSVGANADNKPALPRSREDKRRAVLTLIQDPDWGQWSDRDIARQCKVTHPTVAKLRKEVTGKFTSENNQQEVTGKFTSRNNQRTYITKHGTRAKMNTVNIGKKSPTLPENLLDSTVTERGYHPLFPDQSGKITQLPILDSATVELDTGERDLKPTVAHHLNLNEGGLVEINAHAFNKIDGRRGRIAAVHSHTVEVWLRDVDTMVMQKHTLKYQQVTPLPLEKEPQLKEVCDRLTKLRACNLDPFLVEILNLLERNVVFTPLELEYLVNIEKRHGITQIEQRPE